MQKTKIEWCDYTWNPIKGICQMGCSYCYAKKIYQRFKWDPTPRLDEKELTTFWNKPIPIGSKIFVCSTHELFGEWVTEKWIESILIVIAKWQIYIFQILTKNPFRARFFNFPKNVWLGTTITGKFDYSRLYWLLKSNAKIKFVSFEPLLSSICLSGDHLFPKELKQVDWIVIGGLTGSRKMNCETHPEMKEWIDEIVAFAREHNIPVFIKDNAKYPEVIREFPDGGKPCHS